MSFIEDYLPHACDFSYELGGFSNNLIFIKKTYKIWRGFQKQGGETWKQNQNSYDYRILIYGSFA